MASEYIFKESRVAAVPLIAAVQRVSAAAGRCERIYWGFS